MMASTTKKMLLFCVLFLILGGVMGEDDSKEVKRRESEGSKVEDREREAEGRLREWNTDYIDLAGGIEGRGETKEGRGKEARSREEHRRSGTFLLSETGRREEAKEEGGRSDRYKEERGGNAKETESDEKEHTTAEEEKMGERGEPNGGGERVVEAAGGRRNMEKRKEENVPPQTGNPTETNDKERTRNDAVEVDGVRYEYEREEGKKMLLRSPEEVKEPKVGFKTKEGKETEWLERLSKEGRGDPKEGGELERELREVGGREGRGGNPDENGGTEGEEENGREDPAKRKVEEEEKKRGEEGWTEEGKVETDRKKKFEGEEGGREVGEGCGHARCYGKRRRREEGVGNESEREERFVDAMGRKRKKKKGNGERLARRENQGETERAERYETKEEEENESEEDMRTARGELTRYAFPAGGKDREGAERGDAEWKRSMGGEAKRCGLNATADKDVGRSGNHEKESVGGEKGRSDGSVINFARDSGRKGNCGGGEEGKHTDAREANIDAEGEKTLSSRHPQEGNKEGPDYPSRNEPREEMEKGVYSSKRDDGRIEGGAEELEEELREAGGIKEGSKKMKERASDFGFGIWEGRFHEEEDVGSDEPEDDGKERGVVRGGNKAKEEPFGKIEVNPDASGERERFSSKETEVDPKLNGVKRENKEVNPEEFRKTVEGREAKYGGGKIGRDAAFAEGRPEGAGKTDGDEKRTDKESLRGLKTDAWTRRLIPQGKKTKEVGGCGSECDEHPVRGQLLSPNPRLASRETAEGVKGRTEEGTVSDVIDDELEIDFSSLTEDNALSRLKGEVGGDLEDVIERMSGAAADGKNTLGGANWKTEHGSLARYFDGKRTNKSHGLAKNYSVKNSSFEEKESEKTYSASGKENRREIYVKQIESLKSNEAIGSRQEALKSKAEGSDSLNRVKQEIEKAEITREHSRSTTTKFLRAGTGEAEEYERASFSEHDAPVVVSAKEAAEHREEFIERALNDGGENGRNHFTSLRATDNSMHSRRIPAVKSNRNIVPESNPARNPEAGVGSTIMGREHSGDSAGKRSGPKDGGRWKGEEREKVGRASFLRKDGSLKDALDENLETEEVAKGPRRILMSVSDEGESMEGKVQAGGNSKGEEVSNDISVIERKVGEKNRVPYSTRGPKDKAKEHANGVEFVPRKKEGESEGEGKGGVYSSPRIPSDKHVGGKSIVNSASAISRGGKERTRSGAKNGGGIALGDKFYHREKGGFLAVSMGGTAKGKTVGKRQPTAAGEEKARKFAGRKSKGSRGESGDVTKSTGASVTAKSATTQQILKGQSSTTDSLSEIHFFKAQHRAGRTEIAHARRNSYRAGKKMSATSAKEGYPKPYDITRTTLSAGDYGALEAPPTLSTEAKSLGTVDGTASGKEAEIEYELPNPLTTAPTPHYKEKNGISGSVLVKKSSLPLQVDQGDYVTYQLSPPVKTTLDCRREKNEPIDHNALDNDHSGVLDGKVECSGKENVLGDEEEEHLGYTRLQVRKPRMLDASGFGRGRGSGSVGVLPSYSSGGGKKGTLTVGMILPYIAFGQREYTRAINTAITGLQKSKVRKLEFFKKYIFLPQQVRSVMMQLTPSPTAILNSLCKEFLSVNVSAILYLMNYEKYGRSTASAQYFLQLAGYLGIPVIAWNADNSGLERRASQSSLQLQLAPSLEHQTAAMLSILERYKWHQFSIVTSQIAGHDDFVQAVRERILDMQDVFKFTILNAVLVTKPSDLSELVNSESRVVLLYCTREEALSILAAAADYKITGENYVWVAAQSVIENRQPMPQFPVGMLGVHFDTSMSSLVTEIATAVKVYAYGVEDFVNDPRNEKLSLNTQLSCEGVGDSRWKVGDRFFKYLRNVSVEGEHGKPNIEFTADGVLKAAELKIMNLRPGVSKQLVWEEIGVWKSWEREGLDIKDIVWPGGSHTPPQGVPEKFHMRITFLEEPPYINVAPPDPITGKCSINRGVLCRFAAETDMSGLDVLQAHRNASYYQCCSGFCIDLLEKFSEELGFTYELVRVEDGKWGTLENGKWNGLIADLINRKTDMVMTSLTINSDREAVVDFTVPFMESGIAIVVAKRTGIISPTAFLEPFDTASWMLVGFVAIQVSAFSIFLFEWLSPSGFNMKVAPSTNHRFSLFRTYWLVWAVLFQAAVHVDCPKGFTARFMTNVWAMFAVVFLAIYTANLAAFMITREEFHEFSGIDDHRLAKPFSHKPMYKFGTIPWGHTDSTLKKYFREMHAYMKRHNRSVVGEGIEAVLSGELDAFIYDGTVLDYLVSQDEDCRLLTVGSWYAMTGYGLAFQRNSKYVRMFNQRLLDFRENGDLERLRRYWMTGSCKPGKQERKSSDPLALEQFLSAFLLLMSGILLAAFLLLLEHLYFKYVRHHLARTDRGGCCALVSLSMGKSLTFRGAVYEAQDMYRTNRPRGLQQHQHSGGHRAFTGGGRNCNCSYCEGLHNLWATRRELEACRLRVRHLEKQMEAHGIRPLPPPPPQTLPLLLPLPGSSPGNRRYLNDEDVLRTRDMTRNHVTSTEYCGQLYRPCRTEIAEMETVL